MTENNVARHRVSVTPTYLIEITLLGTSPPTLYFSDKNITIDSQIYLDFIDSLDGIGGELKLLTSDNLNSDISISFKNDPFQTYGYLSQIGDVYPFDGASCTIKECYKLIDGSYTDPETLFVGVLDEPRDITLVGFSCNVSDKIIALDEKFNQAYFNRDDYPLLPTKYVGRIVNEIGFGTVEEVECTGIDVGAKSTLTAEITAAQTSFDVEDAELFPSSDFIIQIGSELMYVTTKTQNTFSGITRGYNGSIANSHVIKDVFEVKTEYVYHLFDHPIQSIDNVFIDEKQQADGYTAYTGQTGDEHSDWPGKAVVSFQTEAFVGKQRNLTYDEAEYNDTFLQREIQSTIFSHPIGVPHTSYDGEITTLDAEIAADVNTFDVADGSSFPAGNFVVQINEELLYVTTRTENTFSEITRGYAETTAVIHVISSIVTEQLYSIGALMPQEIQIFGFPTTDYGTISEQKFIVDLRGINRKGGSQGNESVYLFAFVSIIDSSDGTTKAMEKYSFSSLDGNKIGGSVEISVNGGNWDDYVTIAVSGNHWSVNDEYTTVEATNVRKNVFYTPLAKQYGLSISENTKTYDSMLRSDQLLQYGPIAAWYLSTSQYTKDFSYIEKNLKKIEQQVDRIIYDKPVGVSIGESGKGGLSTRLRTQEQSTDNYYYDASTGIEIIYKTTEQDGTLYKQKHSFSTDGETEGAVIHMAALTKQTVNRTSQVEDGLKQHIDSGNQGNSIGLKIDGTVVLATGTLSWTDIIEVSQGDLFSVGLKSNGTVVSSGTLSGNFGGGDSTEWTGIISIGTGNYQTLGIKYDGTVVAVGGDNAEGQNNVEEWFDIVQVDGGIYCAFGLKSDGTVVTVGRNGSGEGNVTGWTDIVQVSGGHGHTIAVKSDGTVVATGDNSWGQCNVSAWTDIVQVKASDQFSLGLKSDGTVLGIGKNTYGSLNVSTWTNVVQIASSPFMTTGLKPDGTVYSTDNTTSSWTGIKYTSRLPTSWTEEIAHVLAYKEFKVTNNSSANYQLEYDGGDWDDYTVVSISPEKFRKSDITETRSYIAIRNPKKEIEYISTDIEGSDGGNYDTSGEKTIGLKISATASFIEDDATYSGVSGTLLNRPDYVLKYMLKEHLGYTDSEINSTSFAAAGVAYGSNKADFVVDFPIGKTSDRFSDVLKSIASQCRSVIYFKQGAWYLHYLPTAVPDALKPIDYKELANGFFTFQRTPRNEVFNKLQIFYKKNYSKEGTPYDKNYEVTDTTSITLYGTRPVTFELWAIRDLTTAEAYSDYQLAQRMNPRTLVNFAIFFEHFDLAQYTTFDISNAINNGMKFLIEDIKRSGKGVLEISARSWT